MMKLKKLASAVLVMTAAVSGLGASEGVYMGGFGGLNLFKNDDEVVSTQVNKDFTGGLTLGHRWDTGLKLEGEVAYHKTRQSLSEENENRALAVMANAVYELPVEGVRPHLGLGLGWAGQEKTATEGDEANEKSYSQNLAWQALAGANMPINESWEMTADYRYFRPVHNQEDSNHAVVLGIQHLF